MLTPIVIVTLVSSFLLFLVNLILYREYRERALLFWMYSWGFYTLRFLFDLFSVLLPWQGWEVLLQLSVIVSGLFLFQGVYWYLRSSKQLPLEWLLFAILAGGLVLVRLFIPLPSLFTVSFSFLFLGISNLVMGWYFFQNRSIPRMERVFLGTILVIWGIHKLDYPFLRPYPMFAVWGYTLGSILGMATGIGLLLVFLSSERRRAETSESRFRTLVESLDDIFFTLDLEGKHTGVFGRWVEQTGGSTQFLGRTAIDIMGQEAGSIHLEMAQKVSRENKGITYEWEMPLPEGKRYFQTTLSPVRNEKGNCIEIVGVGREITSLRLALEEVQVRLEEKNLLLREIQHRVQNNLQVIISLLNLQLQAAASEETKEALRVAISRIYTFSDLYSQLHDKEDVAHIRMDLFLLSLASRILDSGILPERPEVQWETEEVSLPLDKAITVGLILNELISGYIQQIADNRKKAVKGKLRREGSILEVVLSCEGGEKAKNSSLCFSNRSLRQELIQSLVMHANGKVEHLETEVIVRLPTF